MQRVKIGTRVENLGINKCSVADGMKVRAVLVDPNPQMKYIAFDNVLKKRVEVNQDLLVKYNLKATPTFYYLIAKLNSDMKGNVVSDDFVIEYLQLTNNVNTEFSDAVAENPNFTSLVLSKVTKKGDGGKDFSYLKATPSNYVVSREIEDKLEILRKNPEAIEQMWNLIDRATSITPQEYEALLQSPMVKPNGTEDMPEEFIEAPRKAAPQIEAPAAKSNNGVASRQSDTFDDFDSGTDFGVNSKDDFEF